MHCGKLYIVATPIGNLADITRRAVDILSRVDTILAEDTRHTMILLRQLEIKTRCIAVHDFNERSRAQSLCEALCAGQSYALVSDAGTPLISDPGYHLVKAAHAQQIPVVPIPGVSAVIAALSVAGLPCDRFVFEGFLPAKSISRQTYLQRLLDEPRTLIFYEAPHRIVDCLRDMVSCLGGHRPAVIARELTKRFETVQPLPLAELSAWVEQDPYQQKGEIVILVAGAAAEPAATTHTMDETHILKVLLAQMPLKPAVSMAVQLTGAKKNHLYNLALTLRAE